MFKALGEFWTSLIKLLGLFNRGVNAADLSVAIVEAEIKQHHDYLVKTAPTRVAEFYDVELSEPQAE